MLRAISTSLSERKQEGCLRVEPGREKNHQRKKAELDQTVRARTLLSVTLAFVVELAELVRSLSLSLSISGSGLDLLAEQPYSTFRDDRSARSVRERR